MSGPPTVVNIDDVEAEHVERARVARTRRNLGRAIGSRLAPACSTWCRARQAVGAAALPLVEEEIFVILGGDGVLLLGDEEIPLRPGTSSRGPPGPASRTRSGRRRAGLTYLAYGTRDPGDVCYYPRSNKIAFRGVSVVARLERLDYWDGED